MSFFDKLGKTVINLALTPVEVVKDIATLGGAIVDKDEPFTLQRLKKLCEDLDSDD